jgi:hypothetical protein
MTGLAGTIDLRGGTIRVVAVGSPDSIVAETLLHEILHGISFNRDIGLSESQVDQVAAGLMALFVDNPELVKLITQTQAK